MGGKRHATNLWRRTSLHDETGRVKAVWLVDVDGVINANRPSWGAPPHHGTAYAGAEPWRMRWAPRLVDLMGQWHRESRVELRWATTWCPYADQLELMWGFPPLVRSLADTDVVSRATATAAKLRAAHHVVELEGRPLIWTDDDAIPASGKDLRRLTEAPVPALLIEPPSTKGLGREDLGRVDAWLRSIPDAMPERDSKPDPGVQGSN